MILRLTFGAILLLVIFVSFWQARSHHILSEYQVLAEEVRAGRLVPSDAERLKPVLSQPIRETGWCDLRHRQTLAILSLYWADLLARSKSISPLARSENLEIQIARGEAIRRIRAVLVCTPHDGDMWYRLALVARSMGVTPDRIMNYLDWSRRTAPNEGWIVFRRDEQFTGRAALAQK